MLGRLDSALLAKLVTTMYAVEELKATLEVVVKHLSLPCHETCASKECYGPLLSQCCHGSAVAKGMDCVCPDGIVYTLYLSPCQTSHECFTHPTLHRSPREPFKPVRRRGQLQAMPNRSKTKSLSSKPLPLCKVHPLTQLHTHLFPFCSSFPHRHLHE